MKCVNPRRLPNPAATGIEDAFIKVSCGKCYACLANRRAGWLFRLQNELQSSVGSVFATLTYSDDFCDGELHKEHLQKFFKKLRKMDDFKYYAIGEFGTNTFRPHYHCAIFFKTCNGEYFDLDYYDELITKLWNYGNTMVSRALSARLNYVLHYHTRPKLVNGKKTFCLFSKGLGMSFLDDNIVRFLAVTGKTTIHDNQGHFYVIPRYYRKKISELYDIDLTGKIDCLTEYINDLELFKIRYGCNPWEMSDQRKISLQKDIISKDKVKLTKYNKQDKFI